MVLLRRCSVAMARWAWRLGVIRAMGWWVAGLVVGGCWGCVCAGWVVAPGGLVGGGIAVPLSSMVWRCGGASFGVAGGRCMVEDVPVTSWGG
jgi:hypothetical protein